MSIQAKNEKPDKGQKEIKLPDEVFSQLNVIHNEDIFFHNWKIISILIVLFISIILSRLIRLGFKPPMHDECMFYFYAHLLAKTGNYDYMPILHGPFLLDLNALVYILLGATEFTIRLMAALLGIILFGWVWGMRKYLGEKGTIFTIIFFILSPTIMFYSRFLRNDIPLEFNILGALYCFLKFIEKGKGSALFGSILFCTLAFCTKENSLFFFFTSFVFLSLLFLCDVIQNIISERKTKKIPYLRISTLFSGDIATQAIIILIALALISLIIFQRTFEGVILKEFKVKEFIKLNSPSKFYYFFIIKSITPFIALSLIIFTIKYNYGKDKILPRFAKLISQNKYYLINAIILSIAIYILLFTTFLTHRRGFFQIYRETFSYWWGQHLEHRIRGEFHYYIPLLLIYEFLPFIIVFSGTLFSLFRNKIIKRYVIPGWIVLTIIFILCFTLYKIKIDTQWLDKTLHMSHPIHIYMTITIFFFGMLQTIRYILRKEGLFAFFFFWFWMSLLLYSYAGEKVPWINVHITIPLLFTSALFIQKLLRDEFYLRSKKILLPIFLVLGLFTFTAAMKVCFVQPANIAERMIYAHISIEFKDAVQEMERIAFLLGTREKTEINVESGLLINWQMRWYFRDYPNLREIGGLDTFNTPICFVDWDKVDPSGPPEKRNKHILENYHFTLIKMCNWWQAPIPDFGLMLKIWKTFIPEDKKSPKVKTDLNNARLEWKKIFNYILYRESFDPLNSQWPTVSHRDCAFCIRKDIFERINLPDKK